ncbi:MAG: MotA/TolQ/ExbB proton channel family protein [Planctomycetales bacterium]|nr:MotA/TolQ/ExbB proton channel family protein [Planctomycetales bacterium]
MSPTLIYVLLQLEHFVYGMLGMLVLFGTFLGILLVRRVTQKRFSSQKAAETFLEDCRELLNQQNFDGVAELCDSPRYWAKAVPQLILLALANRARPMNKLKRMVAEKFEREVLAELDYSLAWVGTCVRTGPMLGLLGTVLGIVGTFGELGKMGSSGGDPGALAAGIGTALFATALGLTVAIPLTLLGALFHVRVGRLQSDVQRYTGEFLEDLEVSLSRAGKR